MAQGNRDLLPAPGWAAVYTGERGDEVRPLVGWLRLGPHTGRALIGLTLSLDGTAVVRVDEIEGFTRYEPPYDPAEAAG